jgi:molybdopterin converting factor small subunit
MMLPGSSQGLEVGRRLELAVEDGTTLAELVEKVLAVPTTALAVVAVNGQVEGRNYLLQAEDRVDLFPPMTGG